MAPRSEPIASKRTAVSASILLYTSGTLGDHLPFVALGAALAKRGHRVRLAMNGALLSTASGTGVEAIALDRPMGPREARLNASAWNHWPDPRRQVKAPAMGSRPDAYVATARALFDLCRTADLFVSTSIRSVPWTVAAASGVPWLTSSLNPIDYAGAVGDPRLRAAVLRQTVTESRALARAALDALGCPVRSLPDDWHGFRSRTVLLAWSTHFSRPSRHGLPRDARLIPTGFWFDEGADSRDREPDPRLRAICEGGPKPIVLTMSSQPVQHRRRLLRAHVDAAVRAGRPLVVQRGWAGFCEDDLPESAARGTVEFFEFLPHCWIFARAACAVQHGGIGSIARALAAGCPLLLEPFGNDQFFNTLRVLRLGVGAALHPERATGPSIARLLEERVLGDKPRQRARAVGRRIRREDGLAAACQAIERVLATRPQRPGRATLRASRFRR
jgi:UDP:flavonoid glycosyltransferase YjiC (YdhE family)